MIWVSPIGLDFFLWIRSKSVGLLLWSTCLYCTAPEFSANAQARLCKVQGVWYGTDLISVNSFCDVIFSLMRKLCYAQYITYNKNMGCKVTWWWSGSAYTVVNGSVPMQFFVSHLLECMNSSNIWIHLYYEFKYLLQWKINEFIFFSVQNKWIYLFVIDEFI